MKGLECWVERLNSEATSVAGLGVGVVFGEIVGDERS